MVSRLISGSEFSGSSSTKADSLKTTSMGSDAKASSLKDCSSTCFGISTFALSFSTISGTFTSSESVPKLTISIALSSMVTGSFKESDSISGEESKLFSAVTALSLSVPFGVTSSAVTSPFFSNSVSSEAAFFFNSLDSICNFVTAIKPGCIQDYFSRK